MQSRRAITRVRQEVPCTLHAVIRSTQSAHFCNPSRTASIIFKTQYDQTKDSLQSTEKYREELNVQVEAARAELANIAKQRQEISNEISALNLQITTKQTELKGLSDVREQIKAMLEAA